MAGSDRGRCAGDTSVWREVRARAAVFFACRISTSGSRWKMDASHSPRWTRLSRVRAHDAAFSAGRIILAGERDMGRGYSDPSIYWFHDQMARRALADNTEPIRIVRRTVRLCAELEAARPDLVMTGEWADPLCFAFLSWRRRREGIRCAVNRRSEDLERTLLLVGVAMICRPCERASAEKRRAANAPVSERARERIDCFRTGRRRWLCQAELGRIRQRSGLRSHMAISRVFARRACVIGSAGERTARQAGLAADLRHLPASMARAFGRPYSFTAQ